jgi:hypothetical protein
MSKGLWKTLALISLTVSTVVALVLIYGFFAFRDNLHAIVSGGPVCWDAKSRAFDSIAAAQMIGRLDLVTMLLTFGAVGLAVFSFIGWWMIRREARDEAREVAAEEVRKVAQHYFEEQDRSKPRGGDEKGGQVSYIDQTPTFSVKDVNVTGAVEDSGGDDAEPK